MPGISILSDQLINKIAAGEVIERPASVVRELVDNSLDAGASQIDVEIIHGGIKLVKVSDNGTGMNREDALLCFERHATSKIRTEDELFDISTLGFRGEALPAIASVSKVTLSTSVLNADTGTKVDIGADREKVISDAPPVKGTVVEIRDIFFNTPARRKFLKSVPTELSHIIETLVQKAFAWPEVAFSLTHNHKEVLHAPAAGNLKGRFRQLYGDDMASDFLEVKKESKAIKISGFTSPADFTRATRSHQLIFVNRRPVKNPTVNHAVYTAYRDVLPKERHPAYFLFLEIDPRSVDVNVHPAKREVKFERPDDVHRFTGAAVYEALNTGCEIDVSPDINAGAGTFHRIEALHARHENSAVSEPRTEIYGSAQTDFFSSGIAEHVQPFFYIGEAFVAAVHDDGLMIIDQHAAHERIMYERFIGKTSIEAEALFLPLRIELPVREYTLLVKQKDFLRSIGLDIEDFGSNNIIIRSIPRELKKADMKGILMDLASDIIEEETSGIRGDLNQEALSKKVAASLACHKSVRGREQLTNEELSKMMSDLDKTEEPGKCPHGRPTRIFFTIDDLQKMFKRKM